MAGQTVAITYKYKGKNRQGKPIAGEMRAQNPSTVRAQLRKQGIIPTTVKKKPKALFSTSKPIKSSDIAVFTRQMATMMKAGVPLVQSFEIVAEGAENENLKELVNSLHEDVSSGVGFGPSLRKHPKYFDDLYCSLIEAGEQSGSLEAILERLALYKEKAEQLKAKIKKALTYPTVVIAVGIIVTAILLIKVIPVFSKTFSSFGAELPAFTQLVMDMSTFAQKWWLATLILIIISIYSFSQAKLRSKKFSDTVDRVLLKIPVIGDILTEAVISRFCRTLATTFASGVPLIDSLDSVAKASGNAVFRNGIFKVRDDVATGVQLNTAMRSSELFPTLVLQLTSIGEESGALDEMMEKAAIHYEESVDNKVDNLTTLLEPMIMSILGILVGGLMIAMYLPIFNLGQVL